MIRLIEAEQGSATDRAMEIGLFLWIALSVPAGYAVHRLWSAFAANRVFQAVIAPGVAVHALSRAAACAMTGAKVQKVHFAGPQGGSVEHDRPRVPLIGETFISLMPLAGCMMALWGVWQYFGGRLGLESAELEGLTLHSWSLWTKKSVYDFCLSLWAVVEQGFGSVYRREMLSLEGLGFLYLLVTFSVGMAPRGEDVKRVFLGLLPAAVLVLLLRQFGWWNSTADGALDALWVFFRAVIAMLSMALAVLIPVSAACRIAGR